MIHNSKNKNPEIFCEEPSLNLKCIVFSVILALFYWFAPKKNKWILLATLYFPYLIMAYYDHYYDCRRFPLRPTYLSLFYAPFKPKDSQQIKEFNNWCSKIKIRVLIVDIIVLITTFYIFFYLI